METPNPISRDRGNRWDSDAMPRNAVPLSALGPPIVSRNWTAVRSFRSPRDISLKPLHVVSQFHTRLSENKSPIKIKHWLNKSHTATVCAKSCCQLCCHLGLQGGLCPHCSSTIPTKITKKAPIQCFSFLCSSCWGLWTSNTCLTLRIDQQQLTQRHTHTHMGGDEDKHKNQRNKTKKYHHHLHLLNKYLPYTYSHNKEAGQQLLKEQNATELQTNKISTAEQIHKKRKSNAKRPT